MDSYKVLEEHFSKIKDERQESKISHKLIDIIIIAICAVICGADGWEDIEIFGKTKLKWLLSFLKLENGIPSADTFARVFSFIKPKEFEKCFLNWINSTVKTINKDIVSIDGKTLRRSYDRKSNKAAIHMVSAWSSLNECVLGQIKTEEKSNEITAIPELLKVLNINGCIVTIDAMGTQKKIAEEIISGGGDYILPVKGNHPTLHREITAFFDSLETEHKDKKILYTEESDKKVHGRNEYRRYWLCEDIDWITSKDEWKNINTVGMTESYRTKNGKTTVKKKYYISSIQPEISIFSRSVRKHWGIENSLHWCLDVAFREDECRIRKGYASENFAVVRHIAINMLKREKTSRRGIAGKRLTAALDDKYRMKVLKAK